MHAALSSVIRSATRKDGERLNIITFPTHERYQSNMADVNANFWMINHIEMKKWNSVYAEMPKNHFMLNQTDDFLLFPNDLIFDAVLSQSKYAQYDVAKKISSYLHVPLICLEHTCRINSEEEVINFGNINKRRFNEMSVWCDKNKEKIGNSNIFISEYSVKSWGFDKEHIVIHHGINTNLFNNKNIKRKNTVLSVVNDWKNRDAECGYYIWKELTKGLNTKVLGSNPGLSEPAKNVNELVDAYNESKIFLNTAVFSPIPTVLLEAMACGCCVVTTKCGMVGEVIQNGVNGFISNDINEIKNYLDTCLKDDELCKKIGYNARKTILEKFNLKKFTENWNNALNASVTKNWWDYEN